MEKQLCDEIVKELTEVREFLEDCDENLADEIGMRDKISGRIFQTAREMPATIAFVRTRAK